MMNVCSKTNYREVKTTIHMGEPTVVDSFAWACRFREHRQYTPCTVTWVAASTNTSTQVQPILYTLSSLDVPKEYPKPAKRQRLRYRSSVARVKRFAEHIEREDQEEVEAECFGERKRRRLEEDVTRMFGIGYVPKEAVKYVEPEEGGLEEGELGGI